MEKIINYYNSNRVSQSCLKDLLIHPMYFNLKHNEGIIKKEKKSFFDLGSLVDCIVLTSEFFDQTFAIYDEDISPQTKTLAEHIVNKQIDYSSYDIILDEIRKLEIFNTIKKLDTLKKKLDDEDFENYITFYQNNKGKTIIDNKMYYKALDIANSFLNSEFLKDYFRAREGVEILTALPIYWVYDDIDCKSLLDLVLINHNNKTISLNDLKTTSDYTKDFKYSIKKYRYDFQAAFYFEAVKWWIKNVRTDLKKYEILPEFNFIVESTTSTGSPLIYRLSKDTIDKGKNGDMYYDAKGKLQEELGFANVFDDLKWHYVSDIWTYTRREYENKGIISCC